MEITDFSKPRRLQNIFRLLRGALLWLIHFNTPFDARIYIQDYGINFKKERDRGGRKKKGKSTEYPEEKFYTRISGVWIRFPKLHYYTFNWAKDVRVSQDLERWKDYLDEALKNRIHKGGTVLLVLHELSRTGAPILGVELAKRIGRVANVIVISLQNGPLEIVLNELGIPVFVIDWKDELIRFPMLEMILQRGKVNRAIVNSICSYHVISLIKKRDIPIVSLVHEFASYVADKEAFPIVHDGSVAVFYPAALVADDAYRSHPVFEKANVRIAPQGLIRAPSTTNADVIASEMQGIRKIFHGEENQDTCIVLGVGTIEPRKGVDLFISTAQAILRMDSSMQFRFVWIGGAINNFFREQYQVYLQEQIRRAGLSKHVHILDPLQNLHAAFREADIFFLSSRLDPLPLVSIEAMEHGLPLVCFEGASGIADYLQESVETSSTVVPYLDTESAAQKIRELINDPAGRKLVGLMQRTFSRERFDMDAYTSKILGEFEVD